MGDFLRELLALVHPERLLSDPRASGAGVRVGVIDSGIDRMAIAQKHPTSATIQGAVFLPEPGAYTGAASAPHGTTVADVILTVAPQAELLSADVFGPAGSSDATAVVRAVHHCLDVWHCHIINLSLGIVEARLQPAARRNEFRRAIELAYHRGVVVVAAAHNDHPLTKSYPAAFAPPLLSVDKAIFADPLEVQYQPREEVEFLAHGRGYLGPFAREPATSWAAPHLTAVAARLLSLCPELRPFEVKALLSFMSRAQGNESVKSPGDHWIELSNGRGYLLHVPPGDPSQPRPVVLLLHGTGGTAKWAQDETRFGKFADEHGIVAVYPQALPPDPTQPPRFLANPPAWSAGIVIAGHKPDDLPYFRELFSDISNHVAIDPTCIYVTGFSNGAAMCFELASQFSDTIAAIAPISGYCRAKIAPKRLVPTLDIIGADDPMTPPFGGVVTSPWTGETLQRPPAFDDLDRWAALIGCRVPREFVRDENGIREERYLGPVEFTVLTIAELGHHWPGGRGQLKRKLAGLPSDRLDANAVVWKFFSRLRLSRHK